MKEYIISQYDGKSLAVYKGIWKRRFKAVLKLLGFRSGNSTKDNWGALIDSALKEQRPRSIKTTTTTHSSAVITAEEKEALLKKIENIKRDQKWILSTGKVVKDVYRTVIEDSSYEHPAHHFILDVNDPLWKKFHFDWRSVNTHRASRLYV